jgi:hypothetical protein
MVDGVNWVNGKCIFLTLKTRHSHGPECNSTKLRLKYLSSIVVIITNNGKDRTIYPRGLSNVCILQISKFDTSENNA